MEKVEMTQQGPKWNKKKFTTAAAAVVGAGLLAAGGLAAGNLFATVSTGTFNSDGGALAFYDGNKWVSDWKVEFKDQGTITTTKAWDGGEQNSILGTRKTGQLNHPTENAAKAVTRAKMLITRTGQTQLNGIDSKVHITLSQGNTKLLDDVTLDKILDSHEKEVPVDAPLGAIDGTGAKPITAKATGDANIAAGVSAGFSIRLVPSKN